MSAAPAPPARTRFLVVGEALVDLVPAGPRAGFVAHPGGSPYNVAITLGRLGADVRLAAQCGDDAFGALLTDRLTRSGVRLDRWRRLPLPSSLAVAALDGAGRAEYRFYFDGTAGLQPAEIDGLDTDVLHAGSIASWRDPAAPAVVALLARARAGGRTLISYDPNARPGLLTDVADARARVERCVAHAHLIKASDDDLAFLYGGAPPAEIAQHWVDLGATLVVVTLGPAGAVAFGRHGRIARCPAPPITVADTVGAGDSFAGGLLSALAAAGLARPDALREAADRGDGALAAALRTAVTVSAITCERPGADPPTAAELAGRLAPSALRPNSPVE